MKQRQRNRIVVDPAIMVGKPIIRGTRITVELILRQLGQGIPLAEILKNYPHLTKEDIYAAIDYAADLVQEERAYPLPPVAYGKIKAFA